MTSVRGKILFFYKTLIETNRKKHLVTMTHKECSAADVAIVVRLSCCFYNYSQKCKPRRYDALWEPVLLSSSMKSKKASEVQGGQIHRNR